MMEYKVLCESSVEGLNKKVNELIEKGWEIRGSHQVVVIHKQNRFSGQQHMDTLIKVEYTQTMIKP